MACRSDTHAKAQRRKKQRKETFMSDPEEKLNRDSLPTGDISSEEFRRFGHEIVDWIANYFEHIEDLPVLAQVEPGELKAQLPSSPPEKGESMEAILADLDRLIVPALTH